MAQPSYPPSPNPIYVIGSQFVLPYQFEVIFVWNPSGDHLITDVNHKIMFKVKRRGTGFHDQRLIVDADDMPIVLLREKILTAHSGWKAFKGNSHADSEMIFIAKTPKMIQSKTNVHVFLGKKASSKDSCDFKITGSWSDRSCTISTGDSSILIAQMHKMKSPENVNDKFMMKIYPCVDYAFVVTLMVIVEAMSRSGAANVYADNNDADSHDSDNDDAHNEHSDHVVGDVVQSIGDVADIIGTMFS